MTLKSLLKTELKNYLYLVGQMQIIKERTNEHALRIQRGEIDEHHTFCSTIIVNSLILSDFSAHIGYLLFFEPHIIRDVIADIVQSQLQRCLPTDTILQKNQIITYIILTPIAIIPHYPAPGICSVSGVVVEHTLPKKIVRTSRWMCNESICTTIKPKIAKGLPATAPHCDHCARPLDEVPSMRDHGLIVTAKILDNEGLHYLNPEWYLYTCISIEGDQNNGEDLQLGDEICCAGTKSNNTLIVWSWFKKCPPPIDIIPTSKLEIIRRQLKDSPWAFVQMLASSIGGKTFPPHMFMHLRTGLLLSLASVNSSMPIPILATNGDTLVVQRLMTDATKAASKCFTNYLTCCVGGYITDGCRRAGTMLMASKGVCYLGDWFPYSGKRGQHIRNAIESGRVVLENGVGEYLPLKTAIWTYKNDPVGKKECEQQDTLLKIFGLNWKAPVTPEIEDEVAFCFMNVDVLVPDISIEELRDYIYAINTRSVQLSIGALDMLQQYFVCTRRIRDNKLPLRSLDLLIAMTEAHARLNQRHVAYPEDAVATLHLCEMALGPSLLVPSTTDEIWEFGDWLKEHVLKDFSSFD